jgi:3-hydroxy-9,10-secoandrosta-1,3,5(10)-triene-9,17-dione monooxygenase
VGVVNLESVIEGLHSVGPSWEKKSALADEVGCIDADNAADIRTIGAARLLQPTDFGGAQSTIENHMRAVAVAGEYCMATSWCLAVWSAHGWMLAQMPIEGQHEIWSDPTNLVSASIVPKTQFRQEGDDVIVSGRFGFGSGCDHAPWLSVGGFLPGEEVTPVICALPAEDVIIDHKSWDVVGLRGTGSKDLVIADEVAVPSHRVLRVTETMTRRAPGQLHYGGPLYTCPWRTTAILVLAAPVIGAAKAAVRRFQERLDDHFLVALGDVQRNDPAAGYRLAESTAEIHAAELLLYDAAARLDQLGAVENVDPVLNASIIRDCGFGVKTLANAVDRLYEASGANAMRADEPIQRLWRDVNAARSHAILTWDHAANMYSRALLESL